MKKILLALAVLTLAGTASANGYHGYHGYHGHRHGGHGSWGWGPVVGGAILGAVVYDIYNRPVVVQQQQPVIVQNPPIVYQPQQNCTAWIETQNQDGTITRTRTCAQ